MADTLSPSRLRELAEIRPAEGRVLSVYMDFNPAEFGTAPAWQSARIDLLPAPTE